MCIRDRFLTAECCLSLNDIRAVSRYSIAAADALDAEHSLKEINAFVRGADGLSLIHILKQVKIVKIHVKM